MHFDSARVSRIWRSGDLLVGHVPLKIRYCSILSEPYLIDNNIFSLFNRGDLPRVGHGTSPDDQIACGTRQMTNELEF